jgi:hypothetical protein
MAQKEKETGTNLDGLFCLGHEDMLFGAVSLEGENFEN